MAMAGVVYDVWQESTGDSSTPCLAIEVTPDQPSPWARHPCCRVAMADPWPIARGDRVTVPVHTAGGHVTLTDGTRLRMLGGIYDRDQPLR